MNNEININNVYRTNLKLTFSSVFLVPGAAPRWVGVPEREAADVPAAPGAGVLPLPQDTPQVQNHFLPAGQKACKIEDLNLIICPNPK